MDTFQIFFDFKNTVKTLYNNKYIPRRFELIATIPSVVVRAAFQSNREAASALSKIFSTWLSWQIGIKHPSLSEEYCYFNRHILKLMLNPVWWKPALSDYLKSQKVELVKTELWLETK